MLGLMPGIAGATAAAVGAVVLLGWALDIEIARTIVPSYYMLVPLGALGFLTGGASLWIQRVDARTAKLERLPIVLATGPLLIGGITLLEWAASWNFGIDLILFPAAVSQLPLSPPGRVPLNSAAVFFFEGAALLFLQHDRINGRLKSQLFGFSGMLVAFIGLAGYLYDVPDLYAMGQRSGMALLTAMTHLLVCLGLVLGSRRRGVAAILVNEGTAGILARRMLPVAIVIPLVLGWLIFKGEAMGMFGTSFGNSVHAISNVVALAAAAAWSARVLSKTDSSRTRLLFSEREARESAEMAKVEAEAARQEAETANSAKSEFLAVMSHELRTPLTAIIGYEELLSDGITGPVNEGQLQQLARIKASAEHLLELIEQILTFARTDVGRERLTLESTSIEEAMRSSVLFVVPLARAKRIELLVTTPPPDAIAFTDPGKLRQILINLLGNAVKFTDQGEVGIRGTVAGDWLKVEVWDSGLGIAPEHADKVFEPFWQVEQKITRRVGGTGLGLSVSRRLARLLGGDITFTSEPGKGSTFSLSIPIVSASTSRHTPRSNRNIEAAPTQG